MTSEHGRLRLKSWICALVVIFSNVSGNFFLKRGMPAELRGPFEYITVLFQPPVALGVVLLILWMADLSYVLPVTSVGYVLVALAGRMLLHEQITTRRWSGIALIMAGVALVSVATAPQTVARQRKADAGAAGTGQ